MRYAKALIEYAKDTGAEDRVYHELRMLERSFRKHPDLREALDNPILKIKEKFALICTAAVGNGEVSREFSRFITLVLRNRREYYLQYICLTYLDLYRKSNPPPPPLWSLRMMCLSEPTRWSLRAAGWAGARW